MRFEWDAAKAASNLIKHGIAFEEATSVFDDFEALDLEDAAHSRIESRRLIFGITQRGILAVSYTSRGDKVRLISARIASRHERRIYEVSKRQRH